MQAPNNRPLKSMRQNLREQIGEINQSTVRGSNFKTLSYLIKQRDEKENLLVIYFLIFQECTSYYLNIKCTNTGFITGLEIPEKLEN